MIISKHSISKESTQRGLSLELYIKFIKQNNKNI